MRTSFEVKLVVGMPLAQHNLGPFVVSPFRLSWDANGSSNAECGESAAQRHPICKVLDWEQRLSKETGLTRAQLAHEEGLSKARVTQMFRLLNLPSDARQYLAGLRSRKAIDSFSLRRLLAVAKLPEGQRQMAFEEMQAVAARSAC